MVAGGLFLLYKGTREIHHALEGDGLEGEEPENGRTSLAGVVTQIMLLDVVFSLDSVITAVGMANTLWVMATAIIIAVAIMLVASRPLAEFVQRHPTVKMLALSFLILIGMTLIADGAGLHVPKGYIYAAIGFSVGADAIGIGGHLAMPPLPHHRAYGSVPRRFDWVKLGRRRRGGEDRGRRNSGCVGLVGPPGVWTCARTPSVNRRRPLHGTLARHDGAVL